MPSYLKSHEVIASISKKIELKKALREAKRTNNQEKVTQLTSQLRKIDHKLHTTPLSKT